MLIEKKNLSFFFSFLFCFNSTLLEYYGVEIASGFSSSTVMGFGGIFCVFVEANVRSCLPSTRSRSDLGFCPLHQILNTHLCFFCFLFSLLCTEHYLNLEKGSIFIQRKAFHFVISQKFVW